MYPNFWSNEKLSFWKILLFTDINECEEFGSSLCTNQTKTNNSICINTQGSFQCNCTEGYNKEGLLCIGKVYHFDIFSVLKGDPQKMLPIYGFQISPRVWQLQNSQLHSIAIVFFQMKIPTNSNSR